MKRNNYGFGVIYILAITVLLLTVTGTSFFVWQKTHSTQQNASRQTYPDGPAASKQEVAAAADAFLVARLGTSNFQKYLRQEPSRTSYANPKDSKFDFIAYHFLPEDMYSNNDDVVMVQVNRNNLSEIYTDYVPDCSDEPKQCDFSITKQEAIAIANKQGVSGDVRVNLVNLPGSKDRKLAILIQDCTQKKAVYVDQSSGRVLKTDTGCMAGEL